MDNKVEIKERGGNLGTTRDPLSLENFDVSRAKPQQNVVPKTKSGGFIRKKEIHGRPYWYLVRSVREGKKVRQKVIKYLGSRKPRGRLTWVTGD